MSAPPMEVNADAKPTVSAGAIVLKLLLACLGLFLGAVVGFIIAGVTGLIPISC